MYCSLCGSENEADAKFCKGCGAKFLEDESLEESGVSTSKNSNENPKTKTKKVTKTKNKNTKTTKEKTKKDKKNKNKNNDSRGMTPLQKFLMLILFILVLGLIGVLSYIGYTYYQNKDKVEVPNFVGLNIKEAEAVAAEVGLKIETKEVKTEEEAEKDIVLKQNKKKDKKVIKNSKVILIIGKYEEIIILEDYTGNDIEEVKEMLDEKKIEYEINEIFSDEFISGTVISQSIKEGSKYKKGKVLKLDVAKMHEIEKESSESIEE